MTPEQAAVRYFGTTEDPYSAGWLLPDGSMLDFRRRNSFGFVEHSDVDEVLHDGPADATPWTAIERAMGRGWVRMLGSPTHYEIDFEAIRPLTSAQQRRVREAAEMANSMHMDVYVPGGRGGALSTYRYSDAIAPPTPTAVNRVLREANSAAGAARTRGRWRTHPETRYTVEAARTMPGRYAVYDWETGGLAHDRSGRPVVTPARAEAERYVDAAGNPPWQGFRRRRPRAPLLREPSRRLRRRGRR